MRTNHGTTLKRRNSASPLSSPYVMVGVSQWDWLFEFDTRLWEINLKGKFKMKRYFINCKTNVITTETDPEARYSAINEAELSKKEYIQEYSTIWDKGMDGRY